MRINGRKATDIHDRGESVSGGVFRARAGPRSQRSVPACTTNRYHEVRSIFRRVIDFFFSLEGRQFGTAVGTRSALESTSTLPSMIPHLITWTTHAARQWLTRFDGKRQHWAKFQFFKISKFHPRGQFVLWLFFCAVHSPFVELNQSHPGAL